MTRSLPIKEIKLSIDESGVSGCLRTACGLKSFIYSGLEDAAFFFDARPVGEPVVVGEGLVDGVETRSDGLI